MKRFIAGLAAGCVIATSASVYAASVAATTNAYKVTVNGKETAIEGYNIGGSSYFKLRDVADAVGGFEVGFENNTITITKTEQPQPEGTAETRTDAAPPSAEDMQTRLQQDVADGKITQAQADEMLQNMEPGGMRPRGGNMQPPDGESRP